MNSSEWRIANRSFHSLLPTRHSLLPSRLLQRPRKILDQVISVSFEPGGEADKTFADAELGAGVRGQPLVRRGRGMGDETLRVAEIVRDLDSCNALRQRNARLAAVTSKLITPTPTASAS